MKCDIFGLDHLFYSPNNKQNISFSTYYITNLRDFTNKNLSIRLLVKKVSPPMLWFSSFFLFFCFTLTGMFGGTPTPSLKKICFSMESFRDRLILFPYEHNGPMVFCKMVHRKKTISSKM